MRLGLSLSLGSTYAGGGGGFNPSTLGSSGRWGPDYSLSPWVGAAGGNLVSGGAPVTGTAVNSKVPASFNGTTHQMASASAISSFLSAGAFGVALLVKPAAAGADPGAGTRNTARTILSDGGAGYFGVGITTTGPVAYVFDTSYQDVIATTANPVGAWHVIWVTLAGGVLSVALDGGAYATKSLTPTGDGSIDVMTGALTTGSGFGGLFFSGDEMEIYTRATPWTAPERAALYAYLQTTYPAMALP